jgi:hypothetical protein
MPDDETSTCPECREEISASATKCPHCQARISPGHGGTCPYCKEAVSPEATRCKHCRSDIGPEAEGPDVSRQEMLRAFPMGVGGFGGVSAPTTGRIHLPEFGENYDRNCVKDCMRDCPGSTDVHELECFRICTQACP